MKAINIIVQVQTLFSWIAIYLYSQGAFGGSCKNADNVIAETDMEGNRKARVIPVPAFQTNDAQKVSQILCWAEHERTRMDIRFEFYM